MCALAHDATPLVTVESIALWTGVECAVFRLELPPVLKEGARGGTLGSPAC